ncbi:hypothetical protein CYFUS_002483 [Cystobacter fuscus]|uniref:Uncharacterized protein n=1 Tax=Cystobacter fuscus TaxID=43 RepID=A0A250J0Q3_9BACT|nr:hypothetical protein CYFUS_002483 [Cystobacter fuscus]
MIQENNGLLKTIVPEQLKNKMNRPIFRSKSTLVRNDSNIA